MRCPYCSMPLLEDSPECPGCRLDLRRASRLLGAVPRIEAIISDSTQALTSSEHKRLRRRCEEIQRRFPQVRLQIIFRHFPDPHPLALYAFWMLNHGGFCTETEKFGENRAILILIDPVKDRAAITVGYGLEPFMADEELEAVIGLGEDAWRAKRWHSGMLTVFDGLEALLERAALRTAEAFHPGTPDRPGLGAAVSRRP